GLRARGDRTRWAGTGRGPGTGTRTSLTITLATGGDVDGPAARGGAAATVARAPVTATARAALPISVRIMYPAPVTCISRFGADDASVGCISGQGTDGNVYRKVAGAVSRRVSKRAAAPGVGLPLQLAAARFRRR